MKNYEARRSRSCSQGPINGLVGMPLAESSLIQLYVPVVDCGPNIVDCPSIPWGGRAARGWRLLCWPSPQGTRRLRSRSECYCCTRSAPNFQAEEAFADYLRTDLAEKSPYPLDRYEVLAWRSRALADGERDEAFAGYLRALFATHPPDLIITMVSPAARFIQRHRRDLFPSTPVIFAALDARAIRDATLTANDTMVTVSTDLRATIESILRTLPNTTNARNCDRRFADRKILGERTSSGRRAVRESGQFCLS